MTPHHDDGPRGGRTLDLALLALAVAFALGARLLIGARQYVEYDGYWHVFIAGQHDLRASWAEARQNAHPPLYFLLLRLALALGRTLLAYRAVSIAAGLAAVALAWRAARGLTRTPVGPALAAGMMAAGLPALIVSLEVRSYMLAAAFQLGALVYWVEVAGLGGPAPGRRARVLFAVLASAAVLSHYGSVFFLAACAAAPVILAALDGGYRRALASRLRRAWPADVATAAAPLAVTAVLVLAHVRGLDVRFNHLPGFYYSPPAESPAAFLARTLPATFGLFAPGGTRAAGLALAALAAAASGLLLVRARVGGAETGRAAPAAVLLVMCAAIAAAALRGVYPFGGALRHQFFLFPFLVLTLAAAADLAAQRLPARWRALAACATLAVALTYGAARVARFPITPRGPFAAPVEAWTRAFPRPQAVFVDHFNLIGLFSERHQWDWRALPARGGLANVDEYEVTRGAERLRVVHRRRWNVDFRQRGAWQDLRRILEVTGLPSLTTFVVRQFPDARSERQQERLARTLDGLAREAGLEVMRLELQGQDVYGEFRLSDARRGGPG
jgi:hypothetical protein